MSRNTIRRGFVDTSRGLPYPEWHCGTTCQRGMRPGWVQAMPRREFTGPRGRKVPRLRSFPLNR